MIRLSKTFKQVILAMVNCKLILWICDMLLKASQCNLTLSIRIVIIRRWTHSDWKMNGFSWNTWKYIFDGAEICFFPSLRYSLRVFENKSYSGGNGNPLFLSGPLQPWQTLAFLSQRLIKLIRTSLQVTSRTAFMKTELYCNICRF